MYQSGDSMIPNSLYKPVPEYVKQYATDKEIVCIDAYNKLKSRSKAAKELGLGKSTINNAIKRATKRAAKYGVSPDHNMTIAVPEGQMVKGVSYLIGDDGKPKLTWVKTKMDDNKYLEMLQDTLDAFTEEFKGNSKLVPIPKYVVDDLMVTYEIPDAHVGLYAWAEETGVDFDIIIAEETILGCVRRLVDASPNASTCVVEILGDFFHTDTRENKTTRSGAVLDVDTRYSKVLGVGIRIARAVIERALTKHKKVKVVVAIGNHDDHTALMLSHTLAAYYENNERVEIVENNSKFYYYQHGKVMIGITHGDTVKMTMLAQIMATDQPKMWGDTIHRHWHTGHIHCQKVLEERGCTIESFNTVTAPDNWTHSSGYRSGRSMSCIVYHSEYGEVERHKVDISPLSKPQVVDDGLPMNKRRKVAKKKKAKK